MSVVIRLMRAGAKKRPSYRMVAADSRRQRDGRFLEILGHYNPLSQPYTLRVHKDRVEMWLLRGAQPSEQAASLLRSLGIAMHPPQAPAEKPARSASMPVREPAAKKSPRRTAARPVSARKAEKKVARKAEKKKKTGAKA